MFSEEKCKKILNQFGCDIPFPEIRAFLMGCISSVNHVPMNTIFAYLQDGNEAEFNFMKNVQNYMNAIMGLWNTLTEHHDIKKPFHLSPSNMEPSRQSINQHLALRHSEMTQFITGLKYGETDPDDLSESGQFDIEQIVTITHMYRSIINTPESDKDDTQLPSLIENIEQMEKIITECLNGVIQATAQCRTERLQDMGAPIPHSAIKKVGRNEPCPCGSGKKYKKCCLN